MDVAAEVRAERARRDWTQEQLAEKAGVAVGTVVRIERGGVATLDSVAAVMVALGRGEMTLDDLRSALAGSTP